VLLKGDAPSCHLGGDLESLDGEGRLSINSALTSQPDFPTLREGEGAGRGDRGSTRGQDILVGALLAAFPVDVD